MPLSVRTADVATLRILDSTVLAWAVLWIVVGAWTGVTVWHLSEIGDTVSSSGQAVGTVGEALGELGTLPVVGEQPARLAEEAQRTSADVSSRGVEIKGQVRQLALLLGFAIALIPATPIAGLYLPQRVARRRDRRAVRAALAAETDDPAGLDQYLAERAAMSLTYAEVRRVVPRAARKDPRLRARALADAELSRLGLSRPAA